MALRFAPVGGGTLVTESYDVRWIPTWARVVDVPTNRCKELGEAMEHTLGRLKVAAESRRCPVRWRDHRVHPARGPSRPSSAPPPSPTTFRPPGPHPLGARGPTPARCPVPRRAPTAEP